MPRTRQTAAMSTGGSAKRILLVPMIVDVSSLSTNSEKSDATAHSDVRHCSLCQDGGSLYECDETDCHRAVCDNCIQIPPKELSKLNTPNVKFTCVSCHWKMSRNKKPVYYGFTLNGNPVLDKFLTVKGTFETATNARVHSPPIILLHFRLESIPYVAHFTIIEQMLSEYYHGHMSGFHVFDIPFNVNDDQALEKWSAEAPKMLAKISKYKHVIVFVTTHSDPDRGDLWLGNGADGADNPCSTEVGNWLEFIMGPFKSILNGAMLFLFTCGAVVNQKESFKSLKGGLTSLGVEHALAFGAKRLSTLNTVDLMMKLIKSIVIHGFDFSKALDHSIKMTSWMGKHTAVFHFSTSAVMKYVWAHKVIQPWGEPLPLQCPRCGILDPWDVPVAIPRSATTPAYYRVTCLANCGEKGYEITIKSKEDSMLTTGKDTGWLKICIE